MTRRFTCVIAASLPDRLPRSETLSREVPPRDPGAVPVDDALHDLATVPGRAPPPTIARGQARLDLLPLLIRRDREPRLTHPDITPRASPTIEETRPGPAAGADSCAWAPRAASPQPAGVAASRGSASSADGARAARRSRAASPRAAPGRVHALPTGSRGVREALDEHVPGNDQSTRRPGAGGDAEIVQGGHGRSLPGEPRCMGDYRARSRKGIWRSWASVAGKSAQLCLACEVSHENTRNHRDASSCSRLGVR